MKILLSLALFFSAVANAQTPSERLHKIFAEYFENTLKAHPESATAAGRHEYDRLWTDWSARAIEARRRDRESFMRAIEAIPNGGLMGQDRISARLLVYDLRQSLARDPYETYLLRVSSLRGLHTEVYQTIDRMPGRTARDAENIIARLAAVPAYVDQNIAVLDEAIRRGLVQPRVVADLVEQQLTAQARQDAKTTALLAAVRNLPTSVPAAERDRLLRQATAAYEQSFLPAWLKLHAYIKDTYAPHARESTALSAIPNGKQAYAILVRAYTTTTLTPEQIHALGEREVGRIEGEMQSLVRKTGFTGTLAEFEQKLDADPQQHFHDKEEMLVYCRNVAKIVEPELPRLFNHIPRLLYGIRAIPEDREAATASHAEPPAPDGSAPGWFDLNAYRPEKQVKYDKEALVLHEAVPGHLLQISRQLELAGLPEFRRIFLPDTFIPAYLEGWGLYAESLGSELGVYLEPSSKLGQLASERFRAVRLVVDTGLHAMGWSRDRALDYFRTHAPSQSVSEIDRYISWPGQALSYKVGAIKIRELRDLAQKELGDRFDIREFHDAVLRNGPLPMEMLDQEIRGYIASSRRLP